MTTKLGWGGGGGGGLGLNILRVRTLMVGPLRKELFCGFHSVIDESYILFIFSDSLFFRIYLKSGFQAESGTVTPLACMRRESNISRNLKSMSKSSLSNIEHSMFWIFHVCRSGIEEPIVTSLANRWDPLYTQGFPCGN